MPGAIVHLITGCMMFFIGRYYFKSYFDGKDKLKEKILLAIVCITFTFIPDFFLITYYSTHIVSFQMLVPYHELLHILCFPIAITSLITLKYVVNTKRTLIWIMGSWCILLHLTMDLFIEEYNLWI